MFQLKKKKVERYSRPGIWIPEPPLGGQLPRNIIIGLVTSKK